jgi:hypothetical protein
MRAANSAQPASGYRCRSPHAAEIALLTEGSGEYGDSLAHILIAGPSAEGPGTGDRYGGIRPTTGRKRKPPTSASGAISR